MINRLLELTVWCASFCLVATLPYRLPTALRPTRYVLTIEPHLEQEVFNGSVRISLEVLANTDTITLHARKLQIDATRLKVSNGRAQVGVAKTFGDEETETYTIGLESELQQGGNYTLEVSNFTGSLRGALVGFYVAQYEDEKGRVRKYAVTDFEPADARQAFPCFDEPALKAQFSINIIRRAEYNSLSNEELDATVDLGDGRFQDVYKETPKMSTYIVSYVVSDFQPTQTKERHKVFARPQSIAQGKFDQPIEASVEILQAMENFTGIGYGLTQMKQLALPESGFSTPGMENWGLIVYRYHKPRENSFFWTNSSLIKSMQERLMTISHEFSHQWFGNLVTPSWWSHLWLSEGFATYFQFYIPSIIRPSWRTMDQFVVDRLHDVLSNNLYTLGNYTINHSRDYKDMPLNSEVTNPDDSLQYIIYVKGASIIRMMEHFLTPDLFKKGLQTYLEEKKFASATPADLYGALQKVIDQEGANHLLGNSTVASIMQTWDNSTGFPIVNVLRDYATGSVTFQQTKFCANGWRNCTDDAPWWMPVNYAFQSDDPSKFTSTTADFWLYDQNITISSSSPSWILVNLQQTGYYRVNYDLQNWNRLIDCLNSDDFETIPPVNRAQLINDALHLTLAQQLPFDVPFRLLEYLRRERDYIPIAALDGSLQYLYTYLVYLYKQQNPDFNKFLLIWGYPSSNDLNSAKAFHRMYKDYIRHLLEGPYDYLGIDEKPTDTDLDKLNRASIVGHLQQTYCLKDIRRKFRQLTEDNSTVIPPDLQHYVFCQGAKTKGGKRFLEKFLQTADPVVNVRIKYGLQCYSNRAKTFKKLILKIIKPVYERTSIVKKLKLRRVLPV